MMNVLRRYRCALAVLVLNLLILPVWPRVGANALRGSVANGREMLMVLPPIFIMLGLLDVWVERDAMSKMMGMNAGLRGMLMAFILGSVAAGPLYAAFPIVGVLLRKGSTIVNAIIFIGAWTTTKIVMLLFETSAMGWRFMLMRFILDIPAIIIIAYITEHLVPPSQKAWIYQNASELQQ